MGELDGGRMNARGHPANRHLTFGPLPQRMPRGAGTHGFETQKGNMLCNSNTLLDQQARPDATRWWLACRSYTNNFLSRSWWNSACRPSKPDSRLSGPTITLSPGKTIWGTVAWPG